MAEQKENLFPTLGEIATRTDALKDVEDDDVRLNEDAGALIDQEEGEERGMQEVESLCMRCHEQVSMPSFAHEHSAYAFAGCHSSTAYDYSVFQGDCRLVFPV